jgi:DNA-binding transcriptional MocR family regulator
VDAALIGDPLARERVRIRAGRQGRGQLAGLNSTGVLPGGTRLPPVRRLAAGLGLAGGTVARAYREPEQAGLITGRGRRGPFARTTTETGREEQARYQALSTTPTTSPPPPGSSASPTTPPWPRCAPPWPGTRCKKPSKANGGRRRPAAGSGP